LSDTTLVLEADEVDPLGLGNRILQAFKLIFMYDNAKHLIGVSAIKRPRKEYKAQIFNQAQATDIFDDFPYEIGWIVVSEEYRGNKYSRNLMEAAIEMVGDANVYVTTRLGNIPMEKTNKRYCFKQNGVPYKTTRVNRDYKLVLYTRKHNIL